MTAPVATSTNPIYSSRLMSASSEDVDLWQKVDIPLLSFSSVEGGYGFDLDNYL